MQKKYCRKNKKASFNSMEGIWTSQSWLSSIRMRINRKSIRESKNSSRKGTRNGKKTRKE
jgi:hypothetical protein